MTGWIVMVLLALAVVAGLWRWLRRDAGGLQFLGAALLLAMAGYAWQGRPSMAGAPKAAQPDAPRPKSEFELMRADLLGTLDPSSAQLTAVEPYLERGETERAVDTLQDAVEKSPRDMILWLGLADALMQHADGQLTPAAELAFQRAMEVAPDSPAPKFFFAIGVAHTGQLGAVEGLLQQAEASPGANTQVWRTAFAQVRAGVAQLEGRMQGANAPPLGPAEPPSPAAQAPASPAPARGTPASAR